MAWYRRSSKLVWDNYRKLGSCSRNPLVHTEDSLKQNYKRWRWIGGLGFAGVVYSTNLETVPYTNRTHLVLVPRVLDKKLGEFQFYFMQTLNSWKLLPATHPTSARVESIADNVIKAAQRGLRDQNYHSNYLDCQVVVVDSPDIYACCFPSGKIVVFAGLVEYLESDAEIAAVIAHEVAHALSRHVVELTTKSVGAVILLQQLYSKFALPIAPVIRCAPSVLMLLPVFRKLETEADYIGVLLMASAGYNPGNAVTVQEKFAKLIDHSSPADIFSTYPSQEKRVQLLAQAQDEAMTLYRKSTSFQSPNQKPCMMTKNIP